ncbi:MAG: DUF1565 domain-containing protein [Leptolyngbyaceae cyanobacterium CSU_1_4]|nr:DUF1565 domain-containing protein [Leptolyngbyaceae cyanobacterium CSU_1_4]
MSLTVSPSRHNRFLPWVKVLSIGLLTAAGYASEAIAQPIVILPAVQPSSSDRVSAPVQQFLFVNPSSGNDAGQGLTQRSPFRTVTRALQAVQAQNASSVSIIMLATGTYTPETGEVFPLVMPPGVMLQGDPSTKGQSIVIQGGGTFATATAGRQNVAIVGTGQIIGVTVSNPNPNGYGVWIESGSPTLANNTFTGSNLAGVAIMGNSTPTLWGNAFSPNQAGIVVAATAQPVIKEGLEQVAAAPLAPSPRQRDVRPAGAIAQAPSVQAPSVPSRPPIPATLIQTPPDRSPASIVQRPRLSAVSQSQGTQPSQGSPPSRSTPRATVAPRSQNSADSSLSAPIALQSPQTVRPSTVRPSAVNIPVPAPQSERRLPVSRSTPIPVPPPETQAASPAFTAPPVSSASSNLLRVPAQPPIGHVGDLPVVNVSRNPLQSREAGTRQRAAVRGLRYRVVVAAGRRADQVRSLFPGAFTTYSGGEAVLQVGAFGDRTNAEEAAEILDSNGLNGTIESLDN